jgi:hypothetical protein
MRNPIQTSIPQEDGSERPVIIEPVLERVSGQGLQPTGVFKIYKDAFGDQTHLFTETAEKVDAANDPPDEQNPDYLGKFVFKNGSVQQFEGHVLSIAEQSYLAVLIEQYEEPGI